MGHSLMVLVCKAQGGFTHVPLTFVKTTRRLGSVGLLSLSRWSQGLSPWFSSKVPSFSHGSPGEGQMPRINVPRDTKWKLPAL